MELDLEGELVCTYPAYTEPWKVMAQPDGKLTDVNTGLEYSYLFFVYGCRLGGDLLIREIKSASIQCGEI